jgi:hypothetical protein
MVYMTNFAVLFAIFIKFAKFNQQMFVYTTNFAVSYFAIFDSLPSLITKFLFTHTILLLFTIFIKLAKFNQRRFVYTTNFVVRLINSQEVIPP